MRVVCTVCFWLTAACGRLGFDAIGDPHVALIAPTCPALGGSWTLEPPVLVPELSTSTDDAEIYVTADGLTAYVANYNTTTSFESYHATRPTTDAAWGPLVATGWANNGYVTTSRVAPTADGLEAFVSAARVTIDDSDLWVASRASPGDEFGALVRIDALSTSDEEYDPYPSDDALHLYFVRAPATASTLMMATRPSREAPFDTPTSLPGLIDEGLDDNPAVTPDETMLVFASTRAGGAGGRDLWFATRASPDDPFGPAQPLPVVNTASDETEVDLWGCDFYFASNRGSDNLDIYRSQLVPAP